MYTQEAVHPGGVHPGGREDTQRWGGYTHGEVQGTPRGGKQIKKKRFYFSVTILVITKFVDMYFSGRFS